MFNQLSSTITCFLLGFMAYSQCDLLSGSREVSYETSSSCAPVDVTRFEITYTFLAPQDPNDITVRFFWNDPANTTEDATIANGQLSVATGDMEYTAAASVFTYDRGPECFFEPQSFVYIGGVQCESSEQIQLVTAWDTDDDFGGMMAIDPVAYDICENTPINAVQFNDASTFNCNPGVSPDNPNIVMRHTQFVYGTNYLPGAIREISLDHGGTKVDITDVNGNPISLETRGTAGLLVTGAFFGNIVAVPAPANGPNNVTLPLSAPANPANAIGSQFEITLFNWNVCNPYNNDPVNPNYEDAVLETVLITIVEDPDPSYLARTGGPGGTIATSFCINEVIYFDNLTPGGPYDFRWEFYDGPSDTDPLLGTSNVQSPTFQFATGGDKLVRLIATDPNANGVCEVIYDDIVNISPDAIASFSTTDAGFLNVIDPVFCQTGAAVFEVGFVDNTVLVPNTELRFEFFREGNPPDMGNPDFTEPADGSFRTNTIPPFTRLFGNEEYVIVRLNARNSFTNCSSIAEDTVFVYGRPQPDFDADEACEGQATHFTSIADSIASLTTRVNNDYVVLYEWDFSYDGTFNTELTRSNNAEFERFLDGNDTPIGTEPTLSLPGTYRVALRMTTLKGQCSDLVSFPVTVHPNPNAQLQINPTEICPGESIDFTNTSSNGGTTQYTLEIIHPPSAFSFSAALLDADTSFVFFNPDDTSRTYQAHITAASDVGCINTSTTQDITVNPDKEVGFSDPNYRFFGTNCSPWVSTMEVDQETIDLNATQYQWTLLDGMELIDGYPITVNANEASFNTLNYQIENVSDEIKVYQMILDAEKEGLCIANDTFNIQLSPQPLADFTIEKDEQCEQLILRLEASQKGLNEYQWSFNPAPTLIVDNDDVVEISYAREANTGADFNATISLITTNLASCQSDPEIRIETVARQRPESMAEFTLDPTELQLPENEVRITNLSTAGDSATYAWDFGDGNSSAEEDPGTHTYAQFGSYQITLDVTDQFCTVSTSQVITVLPTAPVLDFEADVLEGCAPLTVQFTNLSQFAESGAFLWEFGDGTISRADNPTHTYFQSGTFSVRLRGENQFGEVSEVQKEDYITVFPRPFADFIVSARVVVIPDQIAVFNNLSENATSFFWDFGDGNTSTERMPRHNYTQEGFYDITLVASNELGCVDTLFRPAEVEAISGGDVRTPNAFTPNLNGPGTEGNPINGGDPARINDVFLPRVRGVERFKMYVYNKWGEMLFKSESQTEGWDGYYRGRLAPAGVYVYKLELRFSDGQEATRVGDVTLIR